MKNIFKIQIICLLGVLGFYNIHKINADIITADIIGDGDFSEDGNFLDDPKLWSYGGGWRDNGAHNQNAVFDAKEATNSPFTGFATLRNQVDFSTITAFNSALNYDVNTTKLTGIDTNSVTHLHKIVGLLKLGGTYEYSLRWEIDINLNNGDKYRLKSNTLDPTTIATDTTLNGGDEFNSWTWLDDNNFSGDPANLAGGGIVLADINTFNVKLLMHVVDPHDGNDPDVSVNETVFFIVDDISISATIETVPEPKTYSLILGLILFTVGLNKLKRKSNIF